MANAISIILIISYICEVLGFSSHMTGELVVMFQVGKEATNPFIKWFSKLCV